LRDGRSACCGSIDGSWERETATHLLLVVAKENEIHHVKSHSHSFISAFGLTALGLALAGCQQAPQQHPSPPL
jgi:hypothetical protein